MRETSAFYRIGKLKCQTDLSARTLYFPGHLRCPGGARRDHDDREDVASDERRLAPIGERRIQ